MIYNLIGSGILVAVGALVGGALVWVAMHRALLAARLNEAFLAEGWSDELFASCESDATISRLSDTVGQLQYKRDKTLEYCKQFRVRGAVVAGILCGEQDQ